MSHMCCPRSSMTGLQITGTALLYKLSPNNLNKFPTKKFFNNVNNTTNDSNNYNNVPYEHEIANHYRDFKMRAKQLKRSRRKRARRRLYYNRSKSLITVTTPKAKCYEKRLEIPMAVKCFPGLYIQDNTTSTHGRQTLCVQLQKQQQQQQQQQQTNVLTICNDTIKRIQEANDFNILRQLAVQYIKRFYWVKKYCQRQNRRRTHSNNNNNTAIYHNIFTVEEEEEEKGKPNLYYKSDFLRITKSTTKTNSYAEKRFHCKKPCWNRSSVNYNPLSATPLHEKNTNNINRTIQGHDSNPNLVQYLQLANDYYERGFLANIKYLEQVGQRNRIKRKREQEIKNNNNTNAIINHHQQQQLQKHFIKESVNINNSYYYSALEKEYDKYSQLNTGYHGIRVVKIKPLCSSNNYPTITDNDQFNNKNKLQSTNNSMNDFLYGNYKVATTTTTTTTTTNNTTFNNLLQNLNDLNINDNQKLPRIILTDYTNTNNTTITANTKVTPALPLLTPNSQVSVINQFSNFVSINTDFHRNSNIHKEPDYQQEYRPP